MPPSATSTRHVLQLTSDITIIFNVVSIATMAINKDLGTSSAATVAADCRASQSYMLSGPQSYICGAQFKIEVLQPHGEDHDPSSEILQTW